jgi:hypothetical protein
VTCGAARNRQRRRPLGTLSLSPEAWAQLDYLAEQYGSTRSGVVEMLIRGVIRIGDAHGLDVPD